MILLQLYVKNKIRIQGSLHVRSAVVVKMYQNRSDVMTRRACIVCIINKLLSIKVKWLQEMY